MKVTTADGNVIEGSLWEFKEMGFVVSPVKGTTVHKTRMVSQLADYSSNQRQVLGYDYIFHVWFTDKSQIELHFYSTSGKMEAEKHLKELFV